MWVRQVFGVLGCVVMMVAGVQAADTLYVNGAVSASGNGQAWATAFKTINAAVASTSDSMIDIWIAKGIYTENVALKKKMNLFGGFAGTEATITDRTLNANQTVINGDDSVCVSVRRSTALVPNPTITQANTCYINGIVFQNGFAKSTINNGNGGAISSRTGTVLNVANCVFINNHARNKGGAIWGDSASYVTIANCKFYSNYCNATGGAIGSTRAVILKISNCLFASNFALGDKGGAIYFDSLRATQTSCFIANNTFVGNGATTGGAIYSLNPFAAGHGWLNNIFAYNKSGVYCTTLTGTKRPTFSNNCYFGNEQKAIAGNITLTANNITSDPLLGNLSGGNFHLTANSPCKNAGVNTIANVFTGFSAVTLDIDGEARKGTGADSVLDIGADEIGTITAWTPKVIYVKTDGSDANDGLLWTSAKKTIQNAMHAATLAGGEVWVKSGTYAENIVLMPWAYLYGGFAGTETARTARNWSTNESKIDGTRANAVVAVFSYSTYTCIDGFTITKGLSNTSSSVSVPTYGGGIYCKNSSPIITNNKITNNKTTSTGGAVFVENSKAVISNNIIMGDTSTGDAAGIYASACSLTVINNIIARNVGNGDGVGIYLNNSKRSTIVNNTIAKNRSTSATNGFALYINDDSLTTMYANNIIAFNTKSVYAQQSGTVTLRNFNVFGNVTDAFSTMVGTTLTAANAVSGNPLFVDTAANNFHLQATSPCINTGLNSSVQASWKDIDGDNRIVNTTVDVGADEVTSSSVIGSNKAAQLTTGLSLVNANPLSKTITVRFSVKTNAMVNLSVYSANGSLVRTLASKPYTAGSYTVQWNGQDAQGSSIAAGCYLLRFTADDFVATENLIVRK